MASFINTLIRPLRPLHSHRPLAAIPLTSSPSPSHFHSLPSRRARHVHQPSTPAMTISEGDTAPDFTCTDIDGQKISLSALRGKNVVLYFSNLAGPGCTTQSCSFRDAAADFADLNARIIAVSAQGAAASQKFKSNNSLPFSVVSDSDRTLQKLYSVPSTLGLLPGRITYVIDSSSIVRMVYNSQFSVSKHVSAAKEALKNLK